MKYIRFKTLEQLMNDPNSEVINNGQTIRLNIDGQDTAGYNVDGTSNYLGKTFIYEKECNGRVYYQSDLYQSRYIDSTYKEYIDDIWEDL